MKFISLGQQALAMAAAELPSFQAFRFLDRHHCRLLKALRSNPHTPSEKRAEWGAGHAESKAVVSLCTLLLLKQFIVAAYSLPPDRIRAFAVAGAEKRKQVRLPFPPSMNIDVSPILHETGKRR